MRVLFLAHLLAFLISSCARVGTTVPATGAATDRVVEATAAPSFTKTAPGEPLPSIAPSPQPGEVDGIGTPLAGLLLQYDIVPSFWYPEQYHPSGRAPQFTLFEDGTLIYVEEDDSGKKALRVNLSPAEAASLVEQALELGFERLESHTDSCPPPGFEDQSCLADGNTHVYRVRLNSGEVRQVAIYEHFANDPGAHESLQAFFGAYRHPDAQLYEPELGALFIVEPSDPAAPPQDGPLRDWPFDPAWLTPEVEGAWMWARVLTGEQLAMVIRTLGTNMGSFYFPHQGGYYRASLVPWLPGVDYSEELPR